MTVCELLKRAGLEAAPSVRDSVLLDKPVTGVACNSRSLAAGELFVAIRGLRYDGAEFADEARSRGAVAVVAEAARPSGFDAPWIQVPDARAALAALGASINGDPSRELVVVGTTGTNGKTTTTYLLEAILESAGLRCGRISSVSYRVGPDEQRAKHTTPEAPELQSLLRRMVDRQCRACALEVSSHALALRRVDGISFDAVVFTNLTRDHLDFHGDMTSYFSAKRRLFEMAAETCPAVVNIDDPYGRTLAAEVRRPVTYGLDAAADVTPDRMALSTAGIDLDLRTARGPLHLQSPLLGRSNTYNIVAAAATGTALDLPLPAIQQGIASVARVPGRMQLVSGPDDPVTVIVDFAHTDDALRGVLETARRIARGRLVTVFGCGGDRDARKRPLMGAVAARCSDLVIVTSDNPRSEDPHRIAEDIEHGLTSGRTPWLTVLDRAEAIERGVREARPGDVVVIAGKGHEQTQVLAGQSVPFDDAVAARAALAARRARARVG